MHRIAAAGLTTVLWDVDTYDWSQPGVESIERAVQQQAIGGSVVLLHDGGSDRTQTVASLRGILEFLLAQGYSFVTVDDFLPDISA